MTTEPMRRLVSPPTVLAIALLCAAGALDPFQAPAYVASPAFFDDDPIARVPESQDASKVQEVDRSLLYDILVNSFARPGDPVTPPRAANVNTIDEVPDSGWFTNRIAARPLDGAGPSGGHPAAPTSVAPTAGTSDGIASAASTPGASTGLGPVTPADVELGPSAGDGPADGPWTIIRSKSEGVTPGFTVRDSRGVIWFLKFDPPGSPELASGAEVASTRLFHAAGYFVPDNRIATLRRDRLVVGPRAIVKIGGGAPRPMADRDIDRLLRRAARSADGTWRVLASRAVAGRPVGPFGYYGRRADDPNDVVPHEHRRELRGLRVFAAWLQHVDTKAGNTLDTVVEEGGRSRVRHYLIDLGSTLGSAGIKPRDYNEGHEALVEPNVLWRGVLGFGLLVRPWRTIPYREWSSVGRFEGERFDPHAWVPSIPNAAFLRARPDDLFWGARRVAAFSDEAIRAAVEAGGYTDPAAARHLGDALLARRNHITRAWLPIVNPIVDPTLDDPSLDGPPLDGTATLRFANAAVSAGAAAPPKGGYQAAWHTFDNATGASTALGTSTGDTTQTPPNRLPRDPGAYVRIDVHAIDPPHRSWTAPVILHFRRESSGWKLVGLQRQLAQ